MSLRPISSTCVVSILKGITTGLAGINFINAGVLHVEHRLIRGFNAGTAAGINFAPTGVSELFVSKSYVTDNGAGATGAGVLIRPTGAGSANVMLTQLHVKNNAGGGSNSMAPSARGTVNLSIIDSEVTGNGNHGIAAFSTAAHVASLVTINRTTSSNNFAGRPLRWRTDHSHDRQLRGH